MGGGGGGGGSLKGIHVHMPCLFAVLRWESFFHTLVIAYFLPLETRNKLINIWGMETNSNLAGKTALRTWGCFGLQDVLVEIQFNLSVSEIWGQDTKKVTFLPQVCPENDTQWPWLACTAGFTVHSQQTLQFACVFNGRSQENNKTAWLA